MMHIILLVNEILYINKMKLLLSLSILFTLSLAQLEEIPKTCVDIENDYIDEIIKCGSNKVCLNSINGEELKNCNNADVINSCDKNNLFQICTVTGGTGNSLNQGISCGSRDCEKLKENVKNYPKYKGTNTNYFCLSASDTCFNYFSNGITY